MVHSNVKEIFAFLRELTINNDREWFHAHKAQYDALRQPWEADIERLIALIGEYDLTVRGLDIKSSVYRIYRDVRFSPDKSPYKNYFSAAIGKGGRHCLSSAYYLHMMPGGSLLCGGIWQPDKEILDRLRHLIDAEPDEFRQIIGEKKLKSLYRFDCETLKSMPKGFDKDNELAEYIKMKEYVLVKYVDDSYFDCDDWVERVASDFKPLLPVHRFLDYVFE